MPKPHVICHMATTIDGRVKIRRWSRIDVEGHVEKAYERVHDKLEGDAWICGRVTMQGYAMGEPPRPTPGRGSTARTISPGPVPRATRSASTRTAG